MVTIYNTTLSATSQRHFSDSLGGGENDWISAEISEDNYSVTIKVKANDSGEQRMAKVFLLAIEGDRGASVKVVQNP